jgi:hypothetical protein
MAGEADSTDESSWDAFAGLVEANNGLSLVG